MARVARAAVLVLCAAIAAGAAGYAIDRLRPPGASAILPAFLPSPVAALQTELEQTIAQNEGHADERALALGRDILRQAPLEPGPLAVAADVALQQRDLERARAAAELALKRDPRNQMLQAWLAEDAAGRGDLQGAAVRLQALMSLDLRNRRQYLAGFARLADNPAGQQLTAQVLEAQPPWGPQLVAELNRSHADLDFLLDVNRNAPDAQPILLQRWISERGVRAAYLAWRELLGEDAPQASWPHDASFKGLPGAAPFNWRMRSDTATIEAKGGLYASYDGRGKADLVDQIVLLPPGDYSLAVTAVTDARADGGQIAWAIACLDARDELARLVLPDTRAQEAAATLAFSVPAAGCEAQRLKLVGVPGEFTLGARTELRSARITAVEAAQR